MIKVNGHDFPREEGMVVTTVLQRKQYTYPAIIVTINGTSIPQEEFKNTIIKDGDDVRVIHLVAGG